MSKIKIPYTGDHFFIRKKGKEAMILEGSIEKCIIADWLEVNMGYHNKTIIVSAHMINKGLET